MIFAKNFARNCENQMLGRWVVCPSNPGYYIEDCRILNDYKIATRQNKCRPMRLSAAMQSQIKLASLIYWWSIIALNLKMRYIQINTQGILVKQNPFYTL